MTITEYNLNIFLKKPFAKLATFLRYSRPTRNRNLIELTPSPLCPHPSPTLLRLYIRPPPCLPNFIPKPPVTVRMAVVVSWQGGAGGEGGKWEGVNRDENGGGGVNGGL